MNAKKETFGTTIRRLRKGKEKTLQQMADAVGVSVAYYSEVELGKRPPFKADKLLLLAHALEANADDLFSLAWETRKVIAFDTERLSDPEADILQSFARGGISPEKLKEIQRILSGE